MAVVEITREQLSDAVRQLPERDRVQILAELLAETNGFPQGVKARQLFKRLRGKYRMDPDDEQRMADLLEKGNTGSLSNKQQRELDALLDESQERTLQLALAVMFSSRTRPKETTQRRGRT